MGGVKGNSHDDTSESSGNGDGHEPAEAQESNTLPVDCPVVAVAETDANSRTSDTHRRGDRERVLGEDEDGNGGAKFHGATCTAMLVGS